MVWLVIIIEGRPVFDLTIDPIGEDRRHRQENNFPKGFALSIRHIKQNLNTFRRER